MKRNKGLNITNTIYQHIKNNNKEYITVTLIFIIGIFLGVMFINNTQEKQISEITTYFNNFIEKFKNIENLENIKMLKQSIFENVIFGILLWFFGTTVIRYTNSIWINIIQRFLFRIYHSYCNINNGTWKRNIIYFYDNCTTKYNIYSSNNSNWSKSGLNCINQLSKIEIKII